MITEEEIKNDMDLCGRDSVMYGISQGKLGLNTGVPFSLGQMQQYLSCVKNDHYYLIGAESGINPVPLYRNIH